MENLAEILVPIFVCVVLPVTIVWLCTRASINRTNRQADLLSEAIRNNVNLDPAVLNALFRSKPVRTPADMQRSYLLRGCIFSMLGLTFAIAAIFTAINGGTGLMAKCLASGILFSFGISYLVVFFVKPAADKNK